MSNKSNFPIFRFRNNQYRGKSHKPVIVFEISRNDSDWEETNSFIHNCQILPFQKLYIVSNLIPKWHSCLKTSNAREKAHMEFLSIYPGSLLTELVRTVLNGFWLFALVQMQTCALFYKLQRSLWTQNKTLLVIVLGSLRKQAVTYDMIISSSVFSLGSFPTRTFTITTA